MRREFIIILLGIICVSTLSSLLSNYVQIELNKVLLDTVVGEVDAGNFTYWQLGHNGDLMVELTSLSGDADLYISDNVRPSYETDRYNFSSATCGPDFVYIPADFPRPIGIGVFGHWSHEFSEYSIQVFMDTSMLISAEHYYALVHRTGSEKNELGQKKEGPPTRHIADEERPRYHLKIFNIIDMMFEMFVL